MAATVLALPESTFTPELQLTDASPTNEKAPSSPSQESVVKRGRGLSTSSARSTNLQHQKSLRGPSPRDHVFISSLNEGSHSGDQRSRRPSLPFNHQRHFSHAQEVSLPRSNSHAAIRSETTSPPRLMTKPRSIEENGFSHWPSEGSGIVNGAVGPLPMSTAAITNPSLNRAVLEEPRRLDRMHSGKLKREHLRSHSKQPQQVQQHQSKSVAEYAMHHLFNSFVGDAKHKIDQCVGTSSAQPEPDVEAVCGSGSDLAFDQLLQAMSHVARHEPTLLIRFATSWCMTHRGTLKDASGIAAQAEILLFGSNQPSQGSSDINETRSATTTTRFMAPAYDPEAVASDRRWRVANYLWCRILVETLAQSSLAAITPARMDCLQGLVYRDLKTYSQEILERSPMKRANWKIYEDFIAVTSEMQFDGLSSRLLVDLAASQKVLGEKGNTDRAAEAETLLILKAMRKLSLRHSSPEVWAESYGFLNDVAKYFSGVHGPGPKQAYCTFLEALLLPIAAKGTKETNDPTWRRIVRTIGDRAAQLSSKPKYWQHAASLQTVLMCTSPGDTFALKWQPILSMLQSKLRDPRMRSTALKLICRLVWSYLRDDIDSQHATSLMLEDIIRSVFFSGRKFSLSVEPAIAEPLIQLIRIIGFKDPSLCFQSIIFPLINSDLFLSSKDLKIDQFEPARIVIGIKSFLAIIGDLESKERPPLPLRFNDEDADEAFTPAQSPLSLRSKAQKYRSSASGGEQLSRPVVIAGFSEITKDHYNRFCAILGKIIIMCDNAVGGQAVLDERFAPAAPKTPVADAFAFNRKDDHIGLDEHRSGFYELLHVAIQALPRFMSADIPFNPLINLLCTGTAHVEKKIASSSISSLKSIARQAHAQQVTVGFARFIFKYNNRYSTMSDGGMLGPSHIENTLNLYVELLKIWIEEIQQRTHKAPSEHPNDKPPLDLSSIWTHVEEVESHGLFFLCSPSVRVRAIAIDVLRLLTKFDTALGKTNARIVQILEGTTQGVIDVEDESLTIVERSRLQRGMRKGHTESTLVELCSSDTPTDISLWYKIFPNLIRTSFELCPHAVILARSIICDRLSQMHSLVETLDNRSRVSVTHSHDTQAHRGTNRPAHQKNELIIAQWKLYLTFACITLTKTGSQNQQVNNFETNHTRKTSKSSQSSADAFDSATDLFVKVIPMLSSENHAIRDATVCGLGSINFNLYKTLLETLERSTAGVISSSRSTPASPGGRNHLRDILRTEVTNVYKLTSHFLLKPEAIADEWVVSTLVAYTKELGIFLGDEDVQKEWNVQKLRIHYCGLLEGLFIGINETSDPLRWMSFQARKAAFALLEGWCGCAPDRGNLRSREEDGLRQISPSPERRYGSSVMGAQAARDKKDLRTAALSAMATLCRGPVRITTSGNKSIQFDVGRMLSWIDAIFHTDGDKFHAIGRRALRNLITYNREHEILLERSLDMLYQSNTPKSLESYLDVVCDVLPSKHGPSPPFWRILVVGLYFLGDNKSNFRTKSARLLRSCEDDQGKVSKLRDLEISISDKTNAVFKKAQFETSQRLAQQYHDFAFHVLSEFCRVFQNLHSDRQRIMVPAMLPWVRILELQVKPDNRPTDYTFMLLMNFFEITVRCSGTLPNEIAAFWKALVAGPYQGNVQLIMDFIIDLCLESKDHSFVEYSKQIIVHLSDEATATLPDRSGSRRQKIVEFLLQKLTPQALTLSMARQSITAPSEGTSLPYIADLAQAPHGNREYPFSLGQLCLIFLVDLVVSPIYLAPDTLPVLLQMVFILWDHHAPLVEDQAREMLVHLIHEMVISKVSDSATKSSAENLVDLIRSRDPTIIWEYSESVAQFDDASDHKTPAAMNCLVNQVASLFQVSQPSIRDSWGRTAMFWATNCFVHHSACRSLQIFRCMLNPLDEATLNNMLSRLSKTVGDEEVNVQVYSAEILRTLGAFIDMLDNAALLRFPKVFWTICAVLATPIEFEFVEALNVLEKYIDKIDLGNPDVLRVLITHIPGDWSGGFSGVAESIYKGCKSGVALEQTLTILDRLVQIPSNELVGGPKRLLYASLANIPRFLHALESTERHAQLTAVAKSLARVADAHQLDDLSKVLCNFGNSRYQESKELLHQSLASIKSAFFPDFEFETLTFLMGLLTNDKSWIKIEVMRMLSFLLADMDLRKPEIADQGPDLLSPLLRLLSTSYSAQVLEVLDHVRTNIQASPMDMQYMRMTIGGSDSTTAFRKNHETTPSLYGIPERTGWSIPMPAYQKDHTRTNLQRIHDPPTVEGNASAAEAEVAFSKQDLTDMPYFPDDRDAMMTTGHAILTENNAGEELVSKLDSLDDFFDGPGNDEGAMRPSLFRYSTVAAPSESMRETVYDHQTAPIIYKTLGHKVSSSSTSNNNAEMRPAPVREPPVMSPSAFTTSSKTPPRPSLSQRSMTSPAVHQSPSRNEYAPADMSTDEPFSDDELSLSRTSTNGSLAPAGDLTLRPLPRTRSSLRTGMRSGFKRLAGLDRHRGANRAQMDDSPEVPKVPDVYLQNPKSSEL